MSSLKRYVAGAATVAVLCTGIPAQAATAKTGTEVAPPGYEYVEETVGSADSLSSDVSKNGKDGGFFDNLSTSLGTDKDSIASGSSDKNGKMDPKKVNDWIAIVVTIISIIASVAGMSINLPR